MGQFTGDYNNPGYVTDTGVELRLNPIGQLVLNAFNIHYEEKHPKPQPPLRVASDDAKTEYLDVKNAAYQESINLWENERLQAMLSWLLERGVRSDPPETWQPQFPELYENGTSPKLIWLHETLFGGDLDWENNDSTMNAILGLRLTTQAGVEVAQKNSRSK